MNARHEIIMHYGGYSCKKCGETEDDAFHLHHIGGTGWPNWTSHQEFLEDAGVKTEHFYRKWLIENNFPRKHEMIVLCKSCHNWIHRFYRNGEIIKIRWALAHPGRSSKWRPPQWVIDAIIKEGVSLEYVSPGKRPADYYCIGAVVYTF